MITNENKRLPHPHRHLVVSDFVTWMVWWHLSDLTLHFPDASECEHFFVFIAHLGFLFHAGLVHMFGLVFLVSSLSPHRLKGLLVLCWLHVLQITALARGLSHHSLHGVFKEQEAPSFLKEHKVLNFNVVEIINIFSFMASVLCIIQKLFPYSEDKYVLL